MALIERPVQGHSNEEGTGAPQQGSTAVRTVCFCFHYDGSRKNVNKIFKNSSAERVEKIRQKTRRQLHWTKQIAGILSVPDRLAIRKPHIRKSLERHIFDFSAAFSARHSPRNRGDESAAFLMGAHAFTDLCSDFPGRTE